MNEVKAVEKEQAGCCGGPAPKETNACCVQDAEAKAAGQAECCSAPQENASAPRCC